MDTDPLFSKAAVTTLSLTASHAGSRNLPTGSKRLSVSKIWGSMMRGVRKYGGEQRFVTIHNVPHVVRVTDACEDTALVNRDNVT